MNGERRDPNCSQFRLLPAVVALASVQVTPPSGECAATMFTTDKDLVFGTTVVPAGKYTLWTLPTPTGAKLIFNSETGQWGTDYHADKDFARVDLTSRQVSPPVDQFVIGVVPQGNGGALRFSWDDREYAAPFTVK
jgi:hypothetical protein